MENYISLFAKILLMQNNNSLRKNQNSPKGC